MATDLRQYLYLYGNYSIRNNRFTIGKNNSESGVDLNSQSFQLARSYGSRVVNQRFTDKTIKLDGEVIVDDSKGEDIESLTTELNRIYSYQDRMFRVIPEYTIICNGNSTSGVTLSDDASNLAVDTSFFQFSNGLISSSLKFDILVANSVANKATITRTISAVNLASRINTGNIEFWVDIPDEYFVTSVDFRIGDNSTNYWSYNFISNYEGKVIENGVNYFSVPFNTISTPPTTVARMTATGSPTFSSVTYIQISVNYSSSATNILNCHFGEVFWVNETRVRNYQTFRQGSVDFSKNYVFSSLLRSYTVNLLNYNGFGRATHEQVVASVTGFTFGKSVSNIDLKGSYEPQPKINIKVNSAVSLTDLRITNQTNNQTAQFTNSWNSNDTCVLDKSNNSVTKNLQPQDFSGKIPSFVVGRNRVAVESLGSGSGSSLTQNSQNIEQFIFASSLTDVYHAQSFVSPAFNGTITQIQVLIRGSNFDVNDAGFHIMTNNAGAPGTILSSTYFNYNSSSTLTWQTLTFNQAFNSNTTYWLGFTNQDWGFGGFSAIGYWGLSNANPYASGTFATRTGSVWSNVTGNDATFRITFTTGFSSNIDYTISYFPLYA